MSDKKTVESLSAIKQYILKSEQNADGHKANILVHVNRKDHGFGVRMVSITVKGDFGRVIIEDLHTLYSGFSNTFTIKDSCFSFISDTLRINTKNALFGEISINIT